MDEKTLSRLLNEVADGRLSPQEAAERLKTLPYDDVGFAKLDTHRALRTGRAEVIFGIGKTPEQVAVILKRLSLGAPLVIATKVGTEYDAAARRLLPEGLVFYETARLLVYRAAPEEKAQCPEVPSKPELDLPHVAVVCGGTADIPIAEEAAITTELYGVPVARYYDVGVAGIHRLLDKADEIRRAGVVVAVAGMEGALASVVGGLVSSPVLAVPTSIGYGASMGGLATLLAMLNSCSLGVSVVNIDNGFGAGYLASKIVKGER